MSSMKAGIYVRVSTQEQSTELQKRELVEYVKARKWNLYRIYEDKATGTDAERPLFKQLMKDSRERKIDIIVCWKLDRLFRSLKHLILTIQELSELGIEFISLKDNIDLTTSSGRLLMHIIGAFAQFEADIIRERVASGLENAKRKGIRLGRPQEIDRTQVLELKKQGLSLNQIAKRLGVSKSGVHKSLSNELVTK